MGSDQSNSHVDAKRSHEGGSSIVGHQFRQHSGGNVYGHKGRRLATDRLACR